MPNVGIFNQVIAVLQQYTYILATGVEAAAGVIIGLAAIQATIRALVLFFRKPRTNQQPQEPKTEDIRLRLGRWLALALEFELAADILRTAIAPTWAEIGQLAAIAAIRTALNYFLQKEIDRETVRNPNKNVPGKSDSAIGGQAANAQQAKLDTSGGDGMQSVKSIIGRHKNVNQSR
jgi:uncharacterized membrane protein